MKPARQLRSARMKLLRAEEHLGQLIAEHDRFLVERNPYRMLQEIDPHEPYYFIWRVKIEELPPIEKWSSLVGECVHSLRSALDHTAFELVQINSPGTTFSEFPIFKDRQKWDTEHMGKLPGVSPKVLTQMKWLQPYRRGGALDHLWVVRELDIIDKHRRLNLVSAALTETRWEIVGGRVSDIQPNYGPFEDGTPVIRYKAVPDPPNTQVRVHTTFAFDIAFGQGEPLYAQVVPSLLSGLIQETGGVIARFDRFFS